MSQGNSIIPTDAQYDDYFAMRCEFCGIKLTSAEKEKDDPICDICEAQLDNEDELK